MKLGGEADARLCSSRPTLARVSESALLQYDEFGPGETMLSYRGGHAVLTGRPHKVVLAGEWHLMPDGVRAAAIPRTSAEEMRTRRRVESKGRSCQKEKCRKNLRRRKTVPGRSSRPCPAPRAYGSGSHCGVRRGRAT